jgi:hypothetical protein
MEHAVIMIIKKPSAGLCICSFFSTGFRSVMYTGKLRLGIEWGVGHLKCVKCLGTGGIELKGHPIGSVLIFMYMLLRWRRKSCGSIWLFGPKPQWCCPHCSRLWNVMAHGAETRFRPSAKWTSPFKSVGSSVQSNTGSRGVRISGSNAGYTMFRSSVKSTGYPLHSPVSPSLPLCVTVCHHVSAGLYLWARFFCTVLMTWCVKRWMYRCLMPWWQLSIWS